MIIPDYWAEARRTETRRGRAVTARRFGWSNLSPEDAQTMAEARVEEAVRRRMAGEALWARELKRAYNGSEGVPIREEVLARQGELVVTRNAYGARCLNTEHALFADIDFKIEVRLWQGLLGWALLCLGSGLLAWLFRSAGTFVLLLFLSLLLAAPATQQVRRLWLAVRGGPLQVQRRRIQAFLAEHPGWSLRLYQTPAGLRLLATHETMAARSDLSRAFFQAVGADENYVRMCLNQNCFRARLSGKPWRMGLTGRIRPRSGTWPVSPEQMPARQEWIARYESQAANYAACRYLETLGSGFIHPELQAVVALHDSESRALRQDLPLA